MTIKPSFKILFHNINYVTVNLVEIQEVIHIYHVLLSLKINFNFCKWVNVLSLETFYHS